MEFSLNRDASHYLYLRCLYVQRPSVPSCAYARICECVCITLTLFLSCDDGIIIERHTSRNTGVHFPGLSLRCPPQFAATWKVYIRCGEAAAYVYAIYTQHTCNITCRARVSRAQWRVCALCIMDTFAYPTDGIRMHLGGRVRTKRRYGRDAAILLEIAIKKRQRRRKLVRRARCIRLETRSIGGTRAGPPLIKLVLKIAGRSRMGI